MHKLAAVVTNYKTDNLTERCLENLYKSHDGIKVTYVNNSPEDGSSDFVRNKFPETNIINLDNPGLSVANNIAAKTIDAQYILFLGIDAFPSSHALNAMISYMDKHSDVGILTTKLVMESGEIDYDSHRGFPTLFSSFFKFSGLYKIFWKSGFFNRYYLGNEIDNTEPHEIDATISHFMMVRKEAFDKINGFDENFFLYGEDIDFCYRVKEAGYKNVYLPYVEVLHLKGASIGIRKHNKKQIKRPYVHRRLQIIRSTDAMRLFLKKHYTNKYGYLPFRFMYLSTYVLEKFRLFTEWLSR